MPDCPTDADLTAFLNDALPPDRVAAVGGHVDGCGGCLGRLDKLTRNSDTAAARYHDVSAVTRTGRPGSGGRGADGDHRPDDATWATPAGGLPIHLRFAGLPAIPGFELAAEIGRGGMGVVYRGRHRGLNRLVAVKTILAGGASDPDTVRRFIREAQILGQVRHPQVVQVYEVDTFPGPHGTPVPYLAMELLDGGTLGERLKGGRLPVRDAAELVEGVARAVHAVHLQGVVHRDLKPGNILFGSADLGSRSAESDAGTERDGHPHPAPPISHAALAKVSDFGLAKFVQSGVAELTATGQVVGTPAYMAPEQATGARTLGPAADVYALGAILYECLTGKRPFEGGDLMSVLHRVVSEPPPDLRAVCPDVPRDLAAVAMKCLEKDPKRRYASAGDLADDVARFLTKRPTVARPPTRGERLWLWAERRPAEAMLLTALAVIVATAFILVSAQWRRAEREAADEHAALIAAAQAHAETQAALADTDRLRNESAAREATLRRESALREARLTCDHALTLCDAGRPARGLALLASALALAESTGDAALARAVRVNLAAWRPDRPPPAGVPLGDAAAGPVHALAFDATGGRLAVAVRGRVDVFDAHTGAKRQALDADGETTALRFDPARPRLIRAAGGLLEAIDLDSGKRTPAATADAGRIDRLAFLPGGSAFVALGPGALSRWDADGLRRVKSVSPADLGAAAGVPFTALTVRPIGSEAVLSFGPRVALLDAATFAPVRPAWTAPADVTDARYTSDRSKVFVGLRTGSALLFDAATGTPAAFDMTHDRAITAVAVSPDGAVLLTAGADGTARFWDGATGLPLGPALRHDGTVTRACYSPAGDRVATATAAGPVRVWNPPPAPLDGTAAEVAAKVREWTGGAGGKK